MVPDLDTEMEPKLYQVGTGTAVNRYGYTTLASISVVNRKNKKK